MLGFVFLIRVITRRYNFDFLDLRKGLQHTAECMPANVTPVLLVILGLLDCDFFQRRVVLKQVGEEAEPLVGEDANVELNDVLVLVDCLDDAHESHFF